MRRVTVAVICVAAATALMAADAPQLRPLPPSLPTVERKGETVVKESWDWAAAMIPVARKWMGTEGKIMLLGDSVTYTNHSTRWARAGKDAAGASDSDKAILAWSHADDGRADTNGWWLAVVDKVPGEVSRSETCAAQLQLDQAIQGGHNGLPSVAQLIKTYNPQVAFILLGGADVVAQRETEACLKDMNTILELFLANGTVPVLITLPPRKIDWRQQLTTALNARCLSLAAMRKLPVIDLYGEIVSRQGGEKYLGTLVTADGTTLTYDKSAGPPTEENLKSCGYLLYNYLTVQKLKEVKEKVLDKRRSRAAPTSRAAR